MKKLGIAIKITNRGASDPIVYNGTGWEKNVIDIRDTLKYIKGLEGNKVVLIMSFDKDGCYLTLSRIIGGRGGDNVSAWIYLPNNINISGEDLVSVLEQIKTILLKSRTDEEELKKIADKEYNEYYKVPKNRPSMKYGNYCARYFDAHLLPKLLGYDRYQFYYSKYKAVFLINEKSGISIIENSEVYDITNVDLEKICVLIPPTDKQITDIFGNNVQLLIDYTPFKDVIRVKKGDLVNITAKREGYEDYKFNVKIDKDEVICNLPDKVNIIWEKIINPNMFEGKIELANGHNAKITLESKYINQNNRPSLKGYIEKHGNMIFDPKYNLKQRIIGFITGFCTVLIIGGILSFIIINNKQQQLLDKRTKIKSLETELNSLKTNIEDYRKDISSLNKNLENKEKEIQSFYKTKERSNNELIINKNNRKNNTKSKPSPPKSHDQKKTNPMDNL